MLPDAEGYLVLRREWQPADIVALHLGMPVRAAVDERGNLGRVALVRGNLVYAADATLLPCGRLLDDVIILLDRTDPARYVRVVPHADTGRVHLALAAVVSKPRMEAGIWRERERYRGFAGCDETETTEEVELVPFVEAGTLGVANYREGISLHVEPVTSISYQVWLPYRCR